MRIQAARRRFERCDTPTYGENTVRNTVKKKHKRNTSGLKPPWEPGGPSPNPGGRPKKTLLSDASREWLEQVDEKTGKTNAQLAAEAVGKKLIEGSAEHYRSVGDRTEGKPPQAITIGGSLDLDVDNVDARIKQLAAKIRERKK